MNNLRILTNTYVNRMKTKLSFLLLAVALFLLNGCIPIQIVQGNGNVITREISITDYNILEVGAGSLEMHYEQSDEAPYLQVRVDENIYDMYEFLVMDGNKLVIRPKKEYRSNHNFKPTEFSIVTNSRELQKAAIAGSCKFYVNSPLTTDELKLEMAGSGMALLRDTVQVRDMNINMAGSASMQFIALYCEEFDADIAGSGDIKVAGSAHEAEFDIAGSGRVSAFDFQTKRVSASIAGSGDVDISVSEHIELKVAGSGHIRYKGDPTVSSKIAGSGKAEKVN